MVQAGVANKVPTAALACIQIQMSADEVVTTGSVHQAVFLHDPLALEIFNRTQSQVNTEFFQPGTPDSVGPKHFHGFSPVSDAGGKGEDSQSGIRINFRFFIGVDQITGCLVKAQGCSIRKNIS